MEPPKAKIVAHEREVHGDSLKDSYFWLRERDNSEVLAYLAAENEYAKIGLAHTEDLQERLFLEMHGRIKEADHSVPERQGDYYYYTRIESGEEYQKHCRKYRSLDAPEEVILDENELARDLAYCKVGIFELSPDQTKLAYSLDTNGSERFTIYIKNIATGTLYSESIPDTRYAALAWVSDSKKFFYTALDALDRPYQVLRHVLGTNPQEDVLVYHEPDDAYSLYLSRTRSQAYILLEIQSQVSGEVRYLSAGDPQGTFRLVEPRAHGIEYYVDHAGEFFYIRTNKDAENFRLMRAPVGAPGKECWEEVIPHRPAINIERVDVFRRHMVLVEREQGLRRIRTIHLDTKKECYVQFPEPAYMCWLHENPEFDTNILRFTYESFITPESIYDYNMDTCSMELKKQDEVPGGYDPEAYVSERIFVPVGDGVLVPISLVYKRGLEKNGSNPLYLYGYGAYGSNNDARFKSYRMSLLDRGVVFAIAHVRGGGELGREWYEEGKLLKKKNTFTDFIACAEYLIRAGYTKPERLIAYGGSAGGLLMGAVVNMRPDLFCAVIADVPFVDAVNTMLDPTLPLTVIDYDEWGNPADRAYYEYIKSYSPYDNIIAQDYPHMLVIAGYHDPRVQYWEPAKFVAKLRAHKTDAHRLYLKTNMNLGHGFSSGRYHFLRDMAFEYAFVFA